MCDSPQDFRRDKPVGAVVFKGKRTAIKPGTPLTRSGYILGEYTIPAFLGFGFPVLAHEVNHVAAQVDIGAGNVLHNPAAFAADKRLFLARFLGNPKSLAEIRKIVEYLHKNPPDF